MKDESTLKMMENYPRLFFEEGLSPKEIAERYNLSTRTVYNSLGEIARKNGLGRESLLKRPHSEHIMSGVRNYEPVKPVNADDFRQQVKATIAELSRIQETLNRNIERFKKDIEMMEKEELEWQELHRKTLQH